MSTPSATLASAVPPSDFNKLRHHNVAKHDNDDDTVSLTSHSSHDDSFSNMMYGGVGVGVGEESLLNLGVSEHGSVKSSEANEDDGDLIAGDPLDVQIRQLQDELNNLKSKGSELRQTVYPKQIKQLQQTRDIAVETLRQGLKRKPPTILYTTALREMYAAEGSELSLPYIMNNQITWIQTMHYTFHVNQTQTELVEKYKTEMIEYLQNEKRQTIIDSDVAQENVRKEVMDVADQLRELLEVVEPYEDKEKKQQEVDENDKSLSSITSPTVGSSSLNNNSFSLLGFDFSNHSDDDKIHGSGSKNNNSSKGLQSGWNFLTNSISNFVEQTETEIKDKTHAACDSINQFIEEAKTNTEKLKERGQQTHEEIVTKLVVANNSNADSSPNPPESTTGMEWKTKDGERKLAFKNLKDANLVKV